MTYRYKKHNKKVMSFKVPNYRVKEYLRLQSYLTNRPVNDLIIEALQDKIGPKVWGELINEEEEI